jgi:hypothetical protein
MKRTISLAGVHERNGPICRARRISVKTRILPLAAGEALQKGTRGRSVAVQAQEAVTMDKAVGEVGQRLRGVSKTGQRGRLFSAA